VHSLFSIELKQTPISSVDDDNPHTLHQNHHQKDCGAVEGGTEVEGCELGMAGVILGSYSWDTHGLDILPRCPDIQMTIQIDPQEDDGSHATVDKKHDDENDETELLQWRVLVSIAHSPGPI